MACSSSLISMTYVDRCPRNSLEWDVRAYLFNCSSINQTCVQSDMFLYHCVLNADGRQLLEVCAPYKFIYGQSCTEFDSEGPIIQENSYSCSNASVPCPGVYISTDAHKYQSCYDRVQHFTNNGTTNEPTNCKSGTQNCEKTSIRTIAIFSSVIFVLFVFLFIVAACFLRRRLVTKYNQSPGNIIKNKFDDLVTLTVEINWLFARFVNI